MTKVEFNNLRIGDCVRNVNSGNSFIVMSNRISDGNGSYSLIRSCIADNYTEWELDSPSTVSYPEGNPTGINPHHPWEIGKRYIVRTQQKDLCSFTGVLICVTEHEVSFNCIGGLDPIPKVGMLAPSRIILGRSHVDATLLSS